jgi:toxin YoeB
VPRKLATTSQFREDLDYWRDFDPKVSARIARLVEETLIDPFHGIGKPEPLKYLQAGLWSRRITQEHRLVYIVTKDTVIFLQCRYHYR